MGAVTIKQMADRVAALMEERLNIRGRSLADKVKAAGRRMPRDVRAEAELLAEAAHQAQNPKLMLRIDEARVAAAYDTCVRHLGSVDRAARRRATLMGMASSVAFSIFAVGALFLAVLAWRGLL